MAQLSENVAFCGAVTTRLTQGHVRTHYNAAVSSLRLSISNNHQKGTLKERAGTVLIPYTRFWSFSVHSYYLLQRNLPFVSERVLFASPVASKLGVDEIAVNAQCYACA